MFFVSYMTINKKVVTVPPLPLIVSTTSPAQFTSSSSVAISTESATNATTSTVQITPTIITTVTWKEAQRFLDECKVSDGLQVNLASTRVNFRLIDNSQYVVTEKVSLEEAKSVTLEAINRCQSRLSVTLPRFISWSETNYYLNHCEVDFMESYFNEAEEKVYLKDQTFSTIESRSAVSLSDMKRAAATASKRCSYTVGIKEFPKEINETYWADWTDVLLLLDKCLISAISVGKNARTGGPINEIFPKDNQTFAVSNGVDLETVKVAVNNASKKCGYNIKAFKQTGGDQ